MLSQRVLAGLVSQTYCDELFQKVQFSDEACSWISIPPGLSVAFCSDETMAQSFPWEEEDEIHALSLALSLFLFSTHLPILVMFVEMED